MSAAYLCQPLCIVLAHDPAFRRRRGGGPQPEVMMAERRLYGAEAVSALYAWLRCRESDELPRLRDIAEQAGITSHYVVWLALATLMRQGRITLRHGTRSLHRGHQAIRVLATGRVLKTAGCPFEAPVFVGDVGP